MNRKTERHLRLLVLVATMAAVVGLSGCASSGRVDDLQTQLNSVVADVAAVKTTAAVANDKADAAIRAANSAQNAAQEANRRAANTDEKIDRMFKKAMHK